MKTLTAILAMMLAVGLAGCGQSSAARPAPLTVEDWKTMPVEAKYTPETLERLKEGDPKLQTPEGWEAFSRTTVAAARKKDFPNGKKR